MANPKSLALLVGTGITLSPLANAEDMIDNEDLYDNEKFYSSSSLIIDDISIVKNNMWNGGCGNGSCSNNGSC